MGVTVTRGQKKAEVHRSISTDQFGLRYIELQDTLSEMTANLK